MGICIGCGATTRPWRTVDEDGAMWGSSRLPTPAAPVRGPPQLGMAPPASRPVLRVFPRHAVPPCPLPLGDSAPESHVGRCPQIILSNNASAQCDGNSLSGLTSGDAWVPGRGIASCGQTSIDKRSPPHNNTSPSWSTTESRLRNKCYRSVRKRSVGVR